MIQIFPLINVQQLRQSKLRATFSGDLPRVCAGAATGCTGGDHNTTGAQASTSVAGTALASTLFRGRTNAGHALVRAVQGMRERARALKETFVLALGRD